MIGMILLSVRKGWIDMDNSIGRKLHQDYYLRFAATAVRRGFVNADQVKAALTEQLEDNILEKPHRPIGQILLEHKWINVEQINIVLNDLQHS